MWRYVQQQLKWQCTTTKWDVRVDQLRRRAQQLSCNSNVQSLADTLVSSLIHDTTDCMPDSFSFSSCILFISLTQFFPSPFSHFPPIPPSFSLSSYFFLLTFLPLSSLSLSSSFLPPRLNPRPPPRWVTRLVLWPRTPHLVSSPRPSPCPLFIPVLTLTPLLPLPPFPLIRTPGGDKTLIMRQFKLNGLFTLANDNH